MNLPLKQLNLSQLADTPKISTSEYDREKIDIGIVHLGPGAFHRAHQAVYTETAMNLSGGDWGICGVSLRSTTARDILVEQDNLWNIR